MAKATQDKAAVRKAVQSASQEREAITYHVPAKGAPYKELGAFKPAFSAYTISALIVAGAIDFNKKGDGIVKSRKNADLSVFRHLAGKRAYGYWRKQGLLDMENGTISSTGLSNLRARLDSDSRSIYRTDMDTVRKVHSVVKDGGTLQLGDHRFQFDTKVKIS